MARLNARTTTTRSRGPITTAATPTLRTAEGAPGYERDAKSELFLLGVSYFAGEMAAYEGADTRDQRFAGLVRTIAVQDPQWMVGFITWLRGTANIRTGSVIAAAESAEVLIKAGKPELVPAIINGALQRADEPGEFLAYWRTKVRPGRTHTPRPVDRGLSLAMARLYTEYTLLKYDTGTKGYRFGDVIEIAHPNPAHVHIRDDGGSTAHQAALYKYALDRRRGAEPPADLAMLGTAHRINRLSTEDKRALLLTDDGRSQLKAGGMTWEDIAGFGRMDATAWQAAIPLMGYMALLRNLRNFEEAGIDRATKDQVAAILADPAKVAKSRQLPLRFLSAYRNVPSDFFKPPVDDALNASLANVPALGGNTLALVDRSGSMFGYDSAHGSVTWADTAALFGTAVALRAERATLVEFGTSSQEVRIPRGANLLKVIGSQFHELGGTYTADAVRQHYKGHDRVVIITDEQAWSGHGDPAAQVPGNVPVHTFNLAGYRAAQDKTGPNRYQWGGLNDSCFRLIPMVEEGATANWPWLSR